MVRKPHGRPPKFAKADDMQNPVEQQKQIISAYTRMEAKVDVITEILREHTKALDAILDGVRNSTNAQQIEDARKTLKQSADKLAAAVAANQPDGTERKGTTMAKKVTTGPMDPLVAQIKKNTDVEDSAATLLYDLKGRLDAAVAALPDQTLLTQLQTDLSTHSDALAAAVAANTVPPTP